MLIILKYGPIPKVYKNQFVYQSQKPILDQPTELKFVVQNLKIGDYLKNLVGNVLVTHNSSGQFSNFRFSSTTVLGKIPIPRYRHIRNPYKG